MNIKNIILIVFTGIVIGLVGCSEAERLDHLDSDKPAPEPVTGLEITATPGGAVITYELPDDPNLSYVKAVYEIQPGVIRETKASRYYDTLRVEGFGSTGTYPIKIFSVGKNEKSSEPVEVSVNPLTPPVLSVFSSIDLDATFGGVKVSFENASKANLAVVVMVDSSGQNTWAPVTTFFTSSAKATYSARGLDDQESRIGLFVRDRWGNRSDTLVKLLTPLYEEFIPKDNFKLVKLPSDTWQNTFNYNIEKIWDGVTNNSENVWIVSASFAVPQWFTLDLGVPATFSRMKVYQRANYPYIAPMIKAFEIYGSNEPDADGGWDNWELLGSFTSVKPSGLPFGSTTIEDVEYAVINGEDFDFDGTMATPVRYIRFKTLETWAPGGGVQTSEISFWGQMN
ncbi:DUF5000 domain-containing lipoprotein [Parapedobacter sp. 10938]|uniref:DUF5000 domain-containing lipoprotein n=1 Tax=Parapedobacter flavus TaxID=3110225 RepID=UPI002DBFC862|nr:DUF5000 domain-containing lipoprotein [Parapedobacter sp. 10938]MEC3878514.1 DUF5000 domain-containing lipoprotein [Parapedobacter sp. 10938]